MPQVTQWIDDLREAFGKAEIDAVIRNGLSPQCKAHERFHAIEAGQEVGQPYVPDPSGVVAAPASGLAFVVSGKGKH